MRALLPLIAVMMSGCVTTGDTQGAARALDKALAGRSAGTPIDCIDRTSLSGPEIIDSTTLIYRSGSHVWRNTLEGSCPALRQSSILIIEAHGSQMCRNDLFRATEQGSSVPGPICRLGKFTPYEKPKG